MRINTKVVWDMSGKELVEIHNESYEYTGAVSECKGGGGSSCPPPDNTPQYTYNPIQDQNMMGGLGSLGVMGNVSQDNAGAVQMPTSPGVNAPTSYGTPGGGVVAQNIGGAQYANPMEMMQTEAQINQPIMAYDPNNPFQRV